MIALEFLIYIQEDSSIYVGQQHRKPDHQLFKNVRGMFKLYSEQSPLRFGSLKSKDVDKWYGQI